MDRLLLLLIILPHAYDRNFLHRLVGSPIHIVIIKNKIKK